MNLLDTCEHLVDGCAKLVDQLLAGCPYLTILATSREVLTSEGEFVWTIPPLSVPSPDEDHRQLTSYDSIRLLAPMQERGTLCESQRYLAQLLLEQGRLDEAEKFAMAARETVSAEDIVSRATTRVALAQVRAAQGRDEEAETLFAEALEIISDGEHCRILLDIVPPYAAFLRAHAREGDAAALDARLAQRVPTAA